MFKKTSLEPTIHSAFQPLNEGGIVFSEQLERLFANVALEHFWAEQALFRQRRVFWPRV
jgi:hypothetical protein